MTVTDTATPTEFEEWKLTQILDFATEAGPQGRPLQAFRVLLKVSPWDDSIHYLIDRLVAAGQLVKAAGAVNNAVGQRYVASSVAGLSADEWADHRVITYVAGCGPGGCYELNVRGGLNFPVLSDQVPKAIDRLVAAGQLVKAAGAVHAAVGQRYVASSVAGLSADEWTQQREENAISTLIQCRGSGNATHSEIVKAFTHADRTWFSITKVLARMVKSGLLAYRIVPQNFRLITIYKVV